MSRDILDLIDSTLDDYAVSDDAMRWAPDAPDPTPAPATAPDPEQVQALAGQIQHAIDAAMRHYVAAADEYVRAFATAMARIGKQLEPVFALFVEAKTAQRTRMRHLHSEYHRRTRRSVHR